MLFLVMFLGQKMEMSSSKMQNFDKCFPRSEKIWPPCCQQKHQQAKHPAGPGGHFWTHSFPSNRASFGQQKNNHFV